MAQDSGAGWPFLQSACGDGVIGCIYRKYLLNSVRLGDIIVPIGKPYLIACSHIL